MGKNARHNSQRNIHYTACLLNFCCFLLSSISSLLFDCHPPFPKNTMSLESTHSKVSKAFNTPSPDLASIKTQLTKAKIELTQSGLLVPSPQDARSNPSQVAMARDILEIGALASVRQKDVEGFDRYMGLLRVFYDDCRFVFSSPQPPFCSLPPLIQANNQPLPFDYYFFFFSEPLPPSKSQEPLLGLSLLRLLSSNLISQFHITLETLPAELVASSPFIKHPVNLERWLMEGSYSKVWRARKEVPREEYGYFVGELMGTIR